ncbi:MAG TPA: signal peptidase I [Steroidobacteraceae bacterium]|nr:signal peptidase I [Steroidobacteraceae bacterium]
MGGNVNTWRPTPWIAAVVGFFGGGLGLLYVQRPWYAIAYFAVSVVGSLALLAAILTFDLAVQPDATSWISLAVAIACAVHAYGIAVATTSVAERKWYSRWYFLLAFPLALLTLTLLFRAFAYEPFRIPAESMQPTLPEGSYIFVSKAGFGGYGSFGVTLWRGEPTARIDRGDIVAFRLVDAPSTVYVKRIIGLPGDRIEYANRRLIINDMPAPISLGERDGAYQYAVERVDETDVTIALMPERQPRDFADVVPPGHFFVLGDNRDNSRDSRFIGFIPRDHLVGRVVKVIRPRKR